MKVITSGVWLKKYLTSKVLVAKVLGIICAMGSGTTLTLA